MNPEIQKAVNEESGKPAEAKIMDAVDFAVLREVNQQKEQLYLQMGMLMEAQQQLVDQMKAVDVRKEANAKEMQEKYDLPQNKLWRVNEHRQIICLDMPTH